MIIAIISLSTVALQQQQQQQQILLKIGKELITLLSHPQIAYELINIIHKRLVKKTPPFNPI